MLDSSEVVAFAAATDLDRAREFYQGILGLALVDQNPYACVFDVRGTMLQGDGRRGGGDARLHGPRLACG